MSTHKCQKCDKTYNRKSGLKAHEKLCQVSVFNCPDCGVKLLTKEAKLIHVYGKCISYCQMCPKQFKQAVNFQRHVKRMHSEILEHEKLCQLSVVNCHCRSVVKLLTKESKLIHIFGKCISYCQECQKQFKQAGNFKEHVKRMHSDILEESSASVSGVSTSSLSISGDASSIDGLGRGSLVSGDDSSGSSGTLRADSEDEQSNKVGIIVVHMGPHPPTPLKSKNRDSPSPKNNFGDPPPLKSFPLP